MACWSAENATNAFLKTLRMGEKGKEPDVAEFISALAAGNNAQLMVVACASVADSTTLALVAAAHQTGGRVICILRGLEELKQSKKALGHEANNVKFVVGEAEILMSTHYRESDFVLIDCNLANDKSILRSVQMGGKQKGAVVVGYNAFCKKSWESSGSRTQLLPIGEGLLVTRLGATPAVGNGCGSPRTRSRWIVKVDQCTGEEHVFRVRFPQQEIIEA